MDLLYPLASSFSDMTTVVGRPYYWLLGGLPHGHLALAGAVHVHVPVVAVDRLGCRLGLGGLLQGRTERRGGAVQVLYVGHAGAAPEGCRGVHGAKERRWRGKGKRRVGRE